MNVESVQIGRFPIRKFVTSAESATSGANQFFTTRRVPALDPSLRP